LGSASRARVFAPSAVVLAVLITAMLWRIATGAGAARTTAST